jgi:hypothetical protein
MKTATAFNPDIIHHNQNEHMKTYYKSYDEIAQHWVDGTIKDRAHTDRDRMFAFGQLVPGTPIVGSIYSYGYHFCISRKWVAPDTGKLWYLVTLRSYSPTTRNHISKVVNAIPKDQLVYLPQVDDMTSFTPSDAVARLMPDYLIDLTSPNATEADLGTLVLHHQIQELEASVATYLRSRRPTNPEYSINYWYRNAQQSLARFGLSLPARFDTLRDQCLAHSHARTVRNAELEATYHQRRRLLAA